MSTAQEGSRVKRILGVDYGRRRIGLAVSDGLGLTAQGLDTLAVRSGTEAVEAVARIAVEHKVEEVVVGMPLNMDGSAGPMALDAEGFAAAVAGRTGLPVVRWDERLTSVAAERAVREMDLRTRGRKGVVDRIAAVLILQGYLDRMGMASREEG